MIHGIGIDIIEVERIAEKVSNRPGFRELVFSPEEISFCEKAAHPFEHYAARFAAKEAFLKAAGTGWAGDAHFAEIEIRHQDSGKPEIILLGKTAEMFASLAQHRILVSLTHLKDTAAAVVVIEQP